MVATDSWTCERILGAAPAVTRPATRKRRLEESAVIGVAAYSESDC